MGNLLTLGVMFVRVIVTAGKAHAIQFVISLCFFLSPFPQDPLPHHTQKVKTRDKKGEEHVFAFIFSPYSKFRRC